MVITAPDYQPLFHDPTSLGARHIRLTTYPPLSEIRPRNARPILMSGAALQSACSKRKVIKKGLDSDKDQTVNRALNDGH